MVLTDSTEPSSGAEGPPLRVVRVDLTFDGTDFLGWQRQASGRTVQAVVEGALARVLGAPHRVVASGRLDAGTHARMLVVSFRTAHSMAPSVLARALDAVLPEDVGVLRVSDEAPGFHARRSAAWKWYRYSILTTRGRRPLLRRTTWQRTVPLDRDVLEEGAALLVGRHDFLSFAATGPARRSTVRTLHVLRWQEEHLARDAADLLHLDAVGDGFLHHMVRNLVGTLVLAASPRGGGLAFVRGALDARDRRAAGPTAPAHGLALVAVGTEGEPLPIDATATVESVRRASVPARTAVRRDAAPAHDPPHVSADPVSADPVSADPVSADPAPPHAESPSDEPPGDPSCRS